MKRVDLFSFQWAVWGMVCVSVCAYALTFQRTASGATNGDTEPSRCLSDATIQMSANPTTVTLGQSSVVQWHVGLPSGCGNVHVQFNGQAVGTNGSRTVTPSHTSTFNVVVSETHLGVYGQKSTSAQVAVTYPPRVVIDGSTLDPKGVLLSALDSPNDRQIVELCNVDIDLTGVTGITIGDNRQLIGSPGCERTPRRLGPRIFVTDARGRAPLFVIRGDNVRFSGFRLEGPTDFIAQSDRKEKGIVVSPFSGREPIRNIEISNMEIFHWSGLGVQVLDNVEQAERGRLFNTNPGAVRVRGNFFIIIVTAPAKVTASNPPLAPTSLSSKTCSTKIATRLPAAAKIKTRTIIPVIPRATI